MDLRTIFDPRGTYLPNDTDNNKLDETQWKEMHHLCINVWPSYLTGSEHKVMMFVYARTIYKWVRWNYLSINLIHKGVPKREWKSTVEAISRDPKLYDRLGPMDRMKINSEDLYETMPINLSRSNIQIAVTSLVTKGFLFRIDNNGVPEAALNPYVQYSVIDRIIPATPVSSIKKKRKKVGTLMRR